MMIVKKKISMNKDDAAIICNMFIVKDEFVLSSDVEVMIRG